MGKKFSSKKKLFPPLTHSVGKYQVLQQTLLLHFVSSPLSALWKLPAAAASCYPLGSGAALFQPRGRGTWSHWRKWTAAVLPRYSLMQLCLGRQQETPFTANCVNGAHDGAIVYGRLWVLITHCSVKPDHLSPPINCQLNCHWEQMLFFSTRSLFQLVLLKLRPLLFLTSKNSLDYLKHLEQLAERRAWHQTPS